MDASLFSRFSSELSSFQAADGLAIVTLAVLEGLLSVDNSLVLAILVKGLPPESRKKALTYGIAGAFAFRILALLAAGYLMHFAVFKLVGGAYLIYLAMKHMFSVTEEEAYLPSRKVARNFWMTVAVVELTDIAFSLDSITAAVAMSKKLLVVWMGGVMGIISLRYAAGLFVRLLEKLPKLEELAYQLVFFIGIKLAAEGFHIEIPQGVFWLMMGVIAVMGGSLAWRDHHQRATHTAWCDRMLAEVEAGRVGVEEILSRPVVPGELIAALRARGHLEYRTAPPADEGG